MSRKVKFIGISVTVVALALVGATVAFAHDGGPGGPRGDGDHPLAAYEDTLTEALAGALNMSVDELEAAREAGQRLPEIAEAQGVDLADVEAAMQTVREEVIAQALADGVITEEQAERMQEFGGKRGDREGGRFGGEDSPLADYHDTFEQALADALGMTSEDLQAAQEAGQRLPEIAEAQGVEMDAVKEAMDAAREEVLAQALVDGVITEEQVERFQNSEGKRGGRPGGRPGFGDGTGPVDEQANFNSGAQFGVSLSNL